MDNLDIISYNAKGLRDLSKRGKIFNFLKDKILSGIIFLQETHSAELDAFKWQIEWGNKTNLYLNHGQSNARGTAMAFKNLDFSVNKYISDTLGRLQIMSINTPNVPHKLLLVNIYNENLETEQVKLLKDLEIKLDEISDISEHVIIIGGDWNFILNKNLDALGGNPSLKLNSIAMHNKLSAKYDLIDIYRARNRNSKRYTFRQRTPPLHRRLDHFLVSNILQESIPKVDILASLSSDHSPISLSIKFNNEIKKGPNYWKFNTSLLKDEQFCSKTNNKLTNWQTEFSTLEPQLMWELMKYKMRKFAMKYSKNRAKVARENEKKLEQIIKDFESNPNAARSSETQYLAAKKQFEDIQNTKIEGQILRSKCTWYEDGEKSSKYFLNLEKFNAIQSSIRSIMDENDNEITNGDDILTRIKHFYSTLFENKVNNSRETNMEFLAGLDLPTLSENEINICENEFTPDELLETLQSMEGGKSPGNDGLGKEFYIHFWEKIKQPLFSSFMDAKEKGMLSSSQKQSIIKLLAKKDRDKRLIENWRPISLLNVDTKILSKTIATRLKKVLPSLIKSDQTAYVAGRFIGESSRLTSDILEITQSLNMEGWMVTMDIQKAFDSVDHNFLLNTLENAGFGVAFINWVKILILNQESCVYNAGTSTGYFKLDRGCRQGDPISAYLFILVIEIFFQMVRNDPSVEGLNILNLEYKLTSYADDSTFFLKNKTSVINLLKLFEIFSKHSGLKLNQSKCEIAGIGVLRGANVALCGLKCIDLTKDAIKILGIHYSYNKAVSLEKNFTSVIKKITSCLSLWKWRKLTLAGKITIFKTMGLSKIIYIAFLSTTPNVIIKKLEEIQKDYIWDGKRPKVAHSALISVYEDGGLKDIDIRSKIKALRLSWIRRLYTGSPHPWQEIPKKILEQHLSHEPFFPNMDYKIPPNLPQFYKNIVNQWCDLAYVEPLLPNAIQNQMLWNNAKIKINNNSIKRFIENINFVGDLYDTNGNIRSWNDMRTLYSLPNSLHFKYMQLIDAIPARWKNKITLSIDNFLEANNTNRAQHILYLTRQLPLENLTSKQIYIMLLSKIKTKPTSETTLSAKFEGQTCEWPKIYTLARNATIDSYTRIFHFKTTHNILYLNKALKQMGHADSPMCSYCNASEETTLHLFFECIHTKSLWTNTRNFFLPQLILPDITPQSAFFGLPFNSGCLENHIHLIFKICIYKSRDKKTCNLQYIINKIKQIKLVEDNITYKNPNQHERNRNKWSRITSKLNSN